MKTFKAICSAAVLALALTAPVYAGDIDTPAVKVCAPGDVQSPALSAPIPGDVHTPGVATVADFLLSLFALL